MSAGGTPWRALPVGVGPDELRTWCPRIAAPVAVTGASGFIGSHLAEALLAGGIRPRLLVRDPARLEERLRTAAQVVRGGLDDADALREAVAGCGTVVHLAGLVRADSEERFDRANRVGTANLVRAMAGAAPAARLVHVSSLAASGPAAEPIGRSPEDDPHPVSAYGRSKLAGEAEARRHRGPWTILRPPAVYGPRDIDVLQFFKLTARGLVPIPAGERWVTVLFVADAVRALLAAAGGVTDARVLHLGEPEPRTMAGLVRVLADSGGLRARAVAVPPFLVRALGLGGDLLQKLGWRDVALTTDKARELLARHWSARTASSLDALGLAGFVPMPDGAAWTWAWYRDRGWVRPRAKMPPA